LFFSIVGNVRGKALSVLARLFQNCIDDKKLLTFVRNLLKKSEICTLEILLQLANKRLADDKSTVRKVLCYLFVYSCLIFLSFMFVLHSFMFV